MIVTIMKESDVSIFLVEGKLDSSTSPKLQEKLMLALNEAKKIRMDFKDVEYISSAGLRVLLLGEKTARATGKSMTIYNVPDRVMSIFTMTGFADMLNIETK
ncbi:MAG: STAS domain-containing protein [Candidatus Cloacimonetes bacterium]|nr:STAS domain-containing protein [Candidatus Cloacimonadota bacterium]